ncbi:MAG TPA: hypothetical protein VL282_04720 [Tepidisphaeraceae bacterium]|jgi:hypothetical protein|nr:hypothetical protein [Tepidisphaeraceae bacterium]
MVSQLLVLRVIWAALLIGELTFMIIVLKLGRNMNALPDPQSLTIINGAMLVTLIPAGIVVRRAVYAKGTIDGAVSPQAYTTGNIIFHVLCEGVAFFGLVITMLSGQTGLAFAIALAAMAVQILNFPTGGPMQNR